MPMRDFIERLRSKPEHVRKHIAFFSSAGVTALIALAWVAAVASSGFLAPSSALPVAGEQDDVNALVRDTSSGFSDLLGAVGAFQDPKGTQGASLIIVDGETSSTIDSASEDERTTISF